MHQTTQLHYVTSVKITNNSRETTYWTTLTIKDVHGEEVEITLFPDDSVEQVEIKDER